jgi:myosin heavy subunit
LEQEEYVNEGLDWTKIEFSDNEECIKLIVKKNGILSLLDDQSKVKFFCYLFIPILYVINLLILS